MQILIIYSYLGTTGFLKTLKDIIEEKAREKDHDIIVRDLYEIDFNPVLKSSDFEKMQTGIIPDDIQTEQDFINWADLIIFIYPIWWTGMPAVLKGYIDRVFSKDFAFTFDDPNPIGLLKGKKVMIFNSTATEDTLYETSGMYKALNLTSDTGIFEFCGMEVLLHKYYANITFLNEEEINKMFEETKVILNSEF